MSTRCLIGLKENNKVEYIYCHNDGYIQGGVGETLLRHYNYYDTKRLMQLGDLSSLGNQPKSLTILCDLEFFRKYATSDRHNAAYREVRDNYCESYRDHGETEVDSKVVDYEDFGFGCQSDAEYIYLFDEETRSWLYMDDDMSDFARLTLD